MDYIIWILIFLLGTEIGVGIYGYKNFLKEKEKDKIIPIDTTVQLIKPIEKYDVVYILSNDIDKHKEELCYSLRSLKNFNYNKVWFVGGQPKHIIPDRAIPIKQQGDGSYSKVWNSLIEACKNEEITDKFYLFNDDFFILQEYNQYVNYYISDLDEHIVVHEDYYSGQTGYSLQLRHINALLRKKGCNTLSYEIHMPMLIDKKQALKILLEYHDNITLFRSLYGNIYNDEDEIVKREDCKIFSMDVHITPDDWETVSTTEETFNKLPVGEYIRNTFPERSRFEQ